jgi:hypothetical protein
MVMSLQLMSWITLDAVVTFYWFLGFFIFMRVMTVNNVSWYVPMQYPRQDLDASCAGDKTSNQDQSRSFW